MPENVTESENQERVVWSTSRLYLSLLEAFPKYVQDFQAKWNDWQQAISAEEFVRLNHPSIHPSIHPSTNLTHSPSTWSSVPSFTALTALGPKIIPLVVYQLALNPTDKTAVHLCTSPPISPCSFIPQH